MTSIVGTAFTKVDLTTSTPPAALFADIILTAITPVPLVAIILQVLTAAGAGGITAGATGIPSKLPAGVVGGNLLVAVGAFLWLLPLRVINLSWVILYGWGRFSRLEPSTVLTALDMLASSYAIGFTTFTYPATLTDVIAPYSWFPGGQAAGTYGTPTIPTPNRQETLHRLDFAGGTVMIMALPHDYSSLGVIAERRASSCDLQPMK
jgi:hypothetical protein